MDDVPMLLWCIVLCGVVAWAAGHGVQGRGGVAPLETVVVLPSNRLQLASTDRLECRRAS